MQTLSWSYHTFPVTQTPQPSTISKLLVIDITTVTIYYHAICHECGGYCSYFEIHSVCTTLLIPDLALYDSLQLQKYEVPIPHRYSSSLIPLCEVSPRCTGPWHNILHFTAWNIKYRPCHTNIWVDDQRLKYFRLFGWCHVIFLFNDSFTSSFFSFFTSSREWMDAWIHTFTSRTVFFAITYQNSSTETI